MFVRGGSVYPGNFLYSAGGDGYYWSSVGRSSSAAYSLNFDSGGLGPSNYTNRYVGLSLRCVALGG